MRRVLRAGTGDRRRLLHTIVAPALAVSLLVGTLSVTDSIRSSFRAASRSPAGTADLMIRATAEFADGAGTVSERALVPESLVQGIHGVPGVRSAWGVVMGPAQPVDARGRAMGAGGGDSMGTGWSPGTPLTEGRPPSRPDEVVLDHRLARRHRVDVGDRIKIVFDDSVAEFAVVGLREPSEWETSAFVAFEPQVARRLLGSRGDGFDAIAVQAAPAAEALSERDVREGLRARIGQVLPERYEVVTPDQVAAEGEQSLARALAFLEVALLVFAAVALLVGGFVIANTFTIVVGQRTRELALLRALGAGRRQVRATVLVEAAVMGSLASALGVLGGVVAARALLALMTGIGFDVASTSVVFLPRTVFAGLVSGVTLTAAAAVVPAWKAGRVPVVEGISGVSSDGTDSSRRRAWTGATATAAGAVLVLLRVVGPVGSSFAVVGFAAVTLLVGLLVLVPLIAVPAARAVGSPLIRLFGSSAVLGRENAMRNPHRTGATAAALTIGIGMVGVTAILAASMKASAERAVADTLRADFVVKVSPDNGLHGGVPPVAAARLRSTPGVGVVSEFRVGRWGLHGRTQTLLAIDPATLATVHELDAASRATAERLGPRTVIVRASTAARHGWKVGDRVPMTFSRTGTQGFAVGGTFSSPGPTDYVVSLAAFEANYTQQRDTEIRLRLAPGTSGTRARTAIETALSDLPDLLILDRSQVLAAQQDQVDRVLMPVLALLGLSVLIALIGIANTLALSIHERTRELGLLRSIGMARHQLRAMIRSEAVIIAVIGSTLGVMVAGVLGSLMVGAMRGVGVTVLVVPMPQLAAWVVVATMAGMLAAILPARRAAATSTLEAVATPLS